MEISRRTDYGVRVIIDLAALPEDSRASTGDIAERQNIPAPFLAKIISQLSLSGLVSTYRGSGGGVSLARPASEISLLQVIEALDGPLRLNRCAIEPDACPRNGQVASSPAGKRIVGRYRRWSLTCKTTSASRILVNMSPGCENALPSIPGRGIIRMISISIIIILWRIIFRNVGFT